MNKDGEQPFWKTDNLLYEYISLPYNQVIPLLDIFPREFITMLKKKKKIHYEFRKALFLVVKNLK